MKVADPDIPAQTLQWMGVTDIHGNIPLTTISGGSFSLPGIPLNTTSYDHRLTFDIAVVDGKGGKDIFFVNLPGHADYATTTQCSAVRPDG